MHYSKRVSIDPDVYESIAESGIVAGDFIKTTRPDGKYVAQQWGKPEQEKPTHKEEGLTKNEFRTLFSLGEQVSTDKCKANVEGDLAYLTVDPDTDHPLIQGVTYRDVLRTLFYSFADATVVDVTDANVILGVNTFEMVGLLAAKGRAAEILKGIPIA